jgi:hypothetical protein
VNSGRVWRSSHGLRHRRANAAKDSTMPSRDAKALQTAQLATPTGLEPDAIREVAGALNVLLADMIALYLKTKNLKLVDRRMDLSLLAGTPNHVSVGWSELYGCKATIPDEALPCLCKADQYGYPDGFKKVTNSQLLHHARPVHLDCALADAKVICDDLVCTS